MITFGKKRKSTCEYCRSVKICLPEILEMPSIDIGSNAKLETASSAEILKQANIAKDLCKSLQKMEIRNIDS